jgi:hypothetical protein
MQYDDKNKIIKLHIFLGNRDIRKVRRRQHQYPEFGHTQGEIFKKPAKKYISIQGGRGDDTQKTINFDGS